MISNIGQSIALTTFANAAIAGHSVSLDIEIHPWFRWFAECRFGVGDDRNQQIAANPNEWLAGLVNAGWERAYLFVEPYNGLMDTIMHLAFSGAVHWAPVIAKPDLELIWHERPSYDKTKNPERPWFDWRGGFRIMPGQSSLHATRKEAAKALYSALGEMIDFAKQHREAADVDGFSKMFATGRGHLEASGLLSETTPSIFDWTPPEPIVSLFPEGLYPIESLKLVAAVHDAWALGGMGWWNDWGSADPLIRQAYEKVTGDYYSGMCMCIYAACDVRLAR